MSTCARNMWRAWNKLIVKQKFCASSWLITETKKISLLLHHYSLLLQYSHHLLLNTKCCIIIFLCVFITRYGVSHLKFCLHFLTILHAPFILLVNLSPVCRFLICCSCLQLLLLCFFTSPLLHHHLNHQFADVLSGMYNVLSTFLVAIMLHARSSSITFNNGNGHQILCDSLYQWRLSTSASEHDKTCSMCPQKGCTSKMIRLDSAALQVLWLNSGNIMIHLCNCDVGPLAFHSPNHKWGT